MDPSARPRCEPEMQDEGCYSKIYPIGKSQGTQISGNYRDLWSSSAAEPFFVTTCYFGVSDASAGGLLNARKARNSGAVANPSAILMATAVPAEETMTARQ